MSDEDTRRPRRRRIRVTRDLYHEAYRVIAVTIAAEDRVRVFEHAALAHHAIHALDQAATMHEIAVPIYCFMPDHVHLLLQLGENSDLIRFIDAYKSWTTHVSWRYGFDGALWQRSFYDHILRAEEDWHRHMRYIAENPVRAGIVDDWRAYPFTGSLEFDLAELDW